MNPYLRQRIAAAALLIFLILMSLAGAAVLK